MFSKLLRTSSVSCFPYHRGWRSLNIISPFISIPLSGLLQPPSWLEQARNVINDENRLCKSLNELRTIEFGAPSLVSSVVVAVGSLRWTWRRKTQKCSTKVYVSALCSLLQCMVVIFLPLFSVGCTYQLKLFFILPLVSTLTVLFSHSLLLPLSRN